MTDLFGYEKGSVVYYAGSLYEVLESDEMTTKLNSLNHNLPGLIIHCRTKSNLLKLAEDDLQLINKSNKKTGKK